MKCPHHDIELEKKPIEYGEPGPGYDYSHVILGGCVIADDSPREGYECPICTRTFILKDGELVKFYDEDLEEDENWQWPEYITKEQAKKIADEHLAKGVSEYYAEKVYERLWEGANVYNARNLYKECFFVSCLPKQLKGLESTKVLVIKKTGGEVVDFISANDEG